MKICGVARRPLVKRATRVRGKAVGGGVFRGKIGGGHNRRKRGGGDGNWNDCWG